VQGESLSWVDDSKDKQQHFPWQTAIDPIERVWANEELDGEALLLPIETQFELHAQRHHPDDVCQHQKVKVIVLFL
jgi:hypothetical protein